MIYLYTGSNGSGKTLNAIKFIVEVLNKDGNRPVFHYSPDNQPLNINPDKLDWTQISKAEAQNWSTFPDGAIFYIDECRHVFPFRPNNQPIPAFVDSLSEHRSHGFDFVLTAQKPAAQFDPAIQGFIEEHRHLVGKMGLSRSTHYVYQSFCSSPLDPPKLQTCEPVSIPFEKKYYDYYRSASVHTKVRRLPSKKLLLLGLAAFVFVGASVFAIRTILSFGAGSDSGNPANVVSLISGHDVANPSVLRPVDQSNMPITMEQYLAARTPRLPDVPESAPIYDELAVPKTFPRIAACVNRPKFNKCTCYTQQGTLLSISFNTCISYVNSGFFDPYKEDPQDRARGGADRRSPAPRDSVTSL